MATTVKDSKDGLPLQQVKKDVRPHWMGALVKKDVDASARDDSTASEQKTTDLMCFHEGIGSNGQALRPALEEVSQPSPLEEHSRN